MRILIADDEQAPREQLRDAVALAWPQAELLPPATNGLDAWDAFLEHEPAVCFLDIRMPGLNGIEVAQRIRGRAQLVFVTAHGDHALAAFDAGAVDYLMKPIEPARLAQAVARVQQRLAVPAPGPNLAELLARPASEVIGNAPRPPALQVIQAGVGKEVRLIRIDEGNMQLSLRGRPEKLAVSRHFQGLFKAQ